MSGSYILDTNIVIALFAGDKNVTDKLEESREVFVTTQVIGELFFGVFQSAHKKSNLERVHDFISHTAILFSDVMTARIYGEIKAHLQQKGRPIPENDIWIASLAKQHQLTLVSRDKHFDGIPGVTLTQW